MRRKVKEASRSTIRTVDDALRACEAGRHRAGFRALLRLGESGDEQAYHMLGYLYDVGRGTRRSRAKAMLWYLKSYRTGNSSSASNIATMFRDSGKARLEFEWYRRAAALSDGDASLEIAIRYLSGKGVRRSLQSAVRELERVLQTKHTSQEARDTARQLLWGCRRGSARRA